ncbi:MAG: hypothetical protein L6R40_004344 [Gallowayella cf. fulva]|nr:MAG: hypothetical protein L6R40_004344 [Xanthomendoza cf. fulva]
MSRRSTISNLSPYAQAYSPTSPESTLVPSVECNTPSRPSPLTPCYSQDPSYSNSRTWVSPRLREKDEWKRIHEGLHALNLNQPDHSPYTPKSFDDYLQHKHDHLNDRKRDIEDKCLASASTPASTHHPLDPAIAGKSYNDARATVLALETIWCPWDAPTSSHPQPPWPAKEEMREEGDERHTSQFGRFLALPRNPGNETVTYKQRSVVRQHHFDRVWEVPRLDDEGEWFEEGVMGELVGGGLLRELER